MDLLLAEIAQSEARAKDDELYESGFATEGSDRHKPSHESAMFSQDRKVWLKDDNDGVQVELLLLKT